MRDTQTPAAIDEWRGFANAGLSATLFHSLQDCLGLQEGKHAARMGNAIGAGRIMLAGVDCDVQEAEDVQLRARSMPK